MTGEDDDKSVPVTPDDEAERLRKAREAFEQDVKERGEAAERDEHGQLPPDALFEIERDESGKEELKRARYSLVKKS
jgi:hypothetical protein